MDSQTPDAENNDSDELVFQDLQPEKPATKFQTSIIRIQKNWPPHWNKRQRFFGITMLSCLLIFLLVFVFINITNQQSNTTPLNASNTTMPGTIVTQTLFYTNVLYVLVYQNSSNNGQLEALNAQTGKLIWSYVHHNTEGFKIVGNILCIQTDTDLVALNASTRKQLWQNQTFSDVSFWQADQNTLFTATSSGIVTALDASTGKQLWQTNLLNIQWHVGDGVFYTASNTGLGVRALNAHNGQQLWYNSDIVDQNTVIDNGHFYLQSADKQYVQALDGKSGKISWQVPTHGKSFILFMYHGFLLLDNPKDAQVEMINEQTGKMLWQHPGTLILATEKNAHQIAISSPQKNEIEILRITDGTLLSHFLYPQHTNSSNVMTLLALENGLAFFSYNIPNENAQNIDSKVVAVSTSNGATVWSSQESAYVSSLQNNIINILPIGSSKLLSLRADTGHILWQHTFDTP